MSLQDAVRFFTEETRSLSCMACCVGGSGWAETALGGRTDLRGTALREDSIFDLASLTKLFTAVLVMRLHESGRLDLSAPVTRYAPQFRLLSGISVDRVLGFEPGLVTPERIDAQPDPASARAMLFAAAPRDIGDGRAYSDIHAMVLRWVIEGAAGEAYGTLLTRELLEPLGLRDTSDRPDPARCVSFDREHRIEHGRYILREGIAPGTPHDPKARAMGTDGCAGHAGLFSTAGDVARFCQAVLRGEVLSHESLRAMARNRTGRRRADGGWTQFLGSLCYVKHPQQYHSEVPRYMTERALAWSGFAGHHLSIDPELGIFALYLGNRVLNRLTMILPTDEAALAAHGLPANGVGEVLWPGGERVVSSVLYVHLKDEGFHSRAEQVFRSHGLLR